MPRELAPFTSPFTRDISLPLHREIAAWVQAEITHHGLQPGHKLPAERDLAARLQVSRMTLRQAIDNLIGQGLISRVPGPRGGSFVAPAKAIVDISDLNGLSLQLVRSFSEVHSTVLEAAEIPAELDPIAATALNVPAGESLLRVRRTRFADGACVVYENSRFPAALFPGFLSHDLTGSLYRLMREHYGRAPQHAAEKLQPLLPESAVAALMSIPTAVPVLNIERTGYTNDDVPVEFSSDVFRTDLLTIVTRGQLHLAP